LVDVFHPALFLLVELAVVHTKENNKLFNIKIIYRKYTVDRANETGIEAT